MASSRSPGEPPGEPAGLRREFCDGFLIVGLGQQVHVLLVVVHHRAGRVDLLGPGDQSRILFELPDLPMGRLHRFLERAQLRRDGRLQFGRPIPRPRAFHLGAEPGLPVNELGDVPQSLGEHHVVADTVQQPVPVECRPQDAVYGVRGPREQVVGGVVQVFPRQIPAAVFRHRLRPVPFGRPGEGRSHQSPQHCRGDEYPSRGEGVRVVGGVIQASGDERPEQRGNGEDDEEPVGGDERARRTHHDRQQQAEAPVRRPLRNRAGPGGDATANAAPHCPR